MHGQNHIKFISKWELHDLVIFCTEWNGKCVKPCKGNVHCVAV